MKKVVKNKNRKFLRQQGRVKGEKERSGCGRKKLDAYRDEGAATATEGKKER
jgi:hypothetical protein